MAPYKVDMALFIHDNYDVVCWKRYFKVLEFFLPNCGQACNYNFQCHYCIFSVLDLTWGIGGRVVTCRIAMLEVVSSNPGRGKLNK